MLRRSLIFTSFLSRLKVTPPLPSCRPLHRALSVAIIGGGPGGLTLARILQRNGINPSVFEREASLNERSQGGTLDLHHESGLKAMKDAGLMGEFMAHARFEGDSTKIQDKTGKVYFEDPPDIVKSIDDPHAHPEIDREDLRAILLDSITKDTIQWGRTVKSVVLSDNQHHTLIFNDDSKETYDLVVGADGAWSVVRPLLTPNQPVYTGVSFIDAIISDVDNRFPSLSAAAGPGMVLSLAHNKAIITQRQSHGYLRVYGALRVPQSWSMSFKPTRDAVLELYSDGWSSDILEFLRIYDESSLVLRKIYALPVPNTWETHPGLTLIGDAAHLMSPFAGEGVNQAMQDANELSHAIIDFVNGGANTLSGVVKQYEKKMFERVEVFGKESAANLDLFFDEDSPKSLIDKFMVHSGARK